MHSKKLGGFISLVSCLPKARLLGKTDKHILTFGFSRFAITFATTALHVYLRVVNMEKELQEQHNNLPFTEIPTDYM